MNPYPTTTTVTSTANPSRFGQAVTFTATVASAGGTPTGTVQFSIDGTNVGGPLTLASGQAAYPITSLSVGSHSVTATYAGVTRFATSTGSLPTQVVNPSNTQTTLSSSANPSVFGETVIVSRFTYFTGFPSSVAGWYWNFFTADSSSES